MIRSEKTRNFIIEKTASIFNKKGFTGTYLSDLTDATGLTKGSIYGNFKDKNEVAIEAFKYNHKQSTNATHKKIKAEMRADEKLITFLNHYKQEFKTIFKNGGCPILNAAVDSDDGNELLKIEVTKAMNSWIDWITNILKEGIRRKEIKQIEPLPFAHKMIAMLEGSILLSKTLNKPEIILQHIELLKQEVREIVK